MRFANGEVGILRHATHLVPTSERRVGTINLDLRGSFKFVDSKVLRISLQHDYRTHLVDLMPVSRAMSGGMIQAIEASQ